MSDGRLLSPRRRDVLLAVVAIALLTGPLWASTLHLGDRTYHYTRTEVVVDGTNVEYASEARVSRHVRISRDLGCQNGLEVRVCAFEELLLENQTISSGAHTNSPDYTSSEILVERYEYALVDETVYESVYVANESARGEDGLYRIDLALERASPERALADVSLPVDSEEVPPAVASAARTGDGYAHREVDVPETPIRLEDDSYYRVYREGWTEPASSLADSLLTYVVPLAGIALLVRLSRRVRVTHVGDGSRRT